MKDAFSYSDHRPALADGLGRESGDELLRSPLGNLTQELAQLLAASIAQNQVSKTTRAGAPTNAELTSLTDLVSAAVAQRTIAPAFKDGLSTLSHTRPRPFFAPLYGPAAARSRPRRRADADSLHLASALCPRG